MVVPVSAGAGLASRARAILRVGGGGAPTATEWAVSAIVLATMLVTTWIRSGPHRPPSAALVTLAVLAWLVLLLRTYRPVVALAGVLVVELTIVAFVAVPDEIVRATTSMGAYQPVPIASTVAAYTLASRTSARVGCTVGLASGAVLFLVGVVSHGSDYVLLDLVVFYLVATGTVLGALVSVRRERVRRAELERAESTRRAVLDERMRIARELHDVVAHNLTLVNAQAGVARYLLRADPDAAETALRGITENTAGALDDLRATIGLLRSDDSREPAADGLAPAPRLADLTDLVTTFRNAGAQVEARVLGEPRDLDDTTDVAAYRIVQEALTNAAKHAPGAAVTLEVRWRDDGLELVVRNARPTAEPPPGTGTGHGLIGMRERAAAAGGIVRTRHTAEGGFELTAELPVRDPAENDRAENDRAEDDRTDGRAS